MSLVGSEQSLGLESVVCASPQQVSCNVADEAVLLSMRNGEYYGLNEVAACIWRHIQEPRTVLQILDALLAEYCDIEKEECEHAVVGFLNEMISLKLIDVV